jgi:hypothetical protein
MDKLVYISGLPFSGLEIMKDILDYFNIESESYKFISTTEAVAIKNKEIHSRHIVFVRNPYLLFMYMHKINPVLNVDDFIVDEALVKTVASIQNLLIDYPIKNNMFISYLPLEVMETQIGQFIFLISSYFNIKIVLTDEFKNKYLTLVNSLKAPVLKSPEIDSFIYAAIRKKWWWFYAVFYNEK